MDDVAEVLRVAREAHRRRDWPGAYERFTTARAATVLSAEDLGALSDAAWWLGRVDECVEAGEAAYQALLDAGRSRAAAMTALELAVSLFLRGDEAPGSGWLGRAQRLLEPLPETPEHGYLRYIIEVEGALDGDDLGAVADAARAVQAIGRRHHDPNLRAAGVVGEGRALVKLGAAPRGVRLLDEAMVAVVSDDLAPEWAGNVYCHLMAACHELADVRRAREWTEATSRWLSRLPAAVLFTGICRVHRSQVYQTAGEWERAEDEAARVCEDLAGIGVASVAEAHYQLGELRRLRGELRAAGEAYSRARQLGRDPQPGEALLCLANGRVDAATASIAAALHAVAADRLARAGLCAAQVEIAVAAEDVQTAGRGCAELTDAAATYGTSGLEAAALHARGALVLAEGRAEEALPALRAACRRWNDVGAPYEVARACTLLGQAYEALGDHAAATAELSSARETFERLGATVDAARAAELLGDRSPPAGLTAREVEVLTLVAEGRTNREVAGELVLSEKTVARHLSNIFTKLGVSTRTEASAFAFEHRLTGS
ncbi:MAG: LuxR family transcriptional regulator [Actinobacteria bacterium]|nr:LuxR family transcriptional regulator [Actinomycetota bacterium]